MEENRTEIPTPDNAEQLDELTEDEQKTLLYMAMNSLRGSWVSPRQRTEVVYYLADGLPTNSCNDIVDTDAMAAIQNTDQLANKAEQYYERIEESGHNPDGRTWRSKYSSIDTDKLLKDRRTIGYLSSLLQHDATWNDWKINKFCDEGDSN